MSLFDWYQPADKLRCPVCDSPLSEWQGKDGPCGLFVWREGVKHPVDQLVGAEESRWSPEEWSQFTLPSTFTIRSYDCPNHRPIVAVGEAPDEIWSSTVVKPFKEKPLPRPWSRS
jgi:hypothetical protein